jgi:phosphoribulokinase
MSKVIAICGDSGSGKTTFSKHLKDTNKNSVILDCDRYHKWERSSHWWKSYTPLNPYSNNLDDMIEDVILLKSRFSISRPDYDHKTGKFTEPEIIEPADVIILCGIHSFHLPNYIDSLSLIHI